MNLKEISEFVCKEYILLCGRYFKYFFLNDKILKIKWDYFGLINDKIEILKIVK